MEKLKVALCQMQVTDNKDENLRVADDMIGRSSSMGAHIVVLPEMFNCPYDNSYFPKFAESYPKGKTIKFLSEVAKREGVYLIGGSIPEKDSDGNIYNSCFVFDKKGENIAIHRKVHLFDVDVKDRITFKESDVLSYGNRVTVFDTEYGKIGIAICYDIRFPEFIRLMSLNGAKMVITPAAFNMTTGPAHWEILFRMRALDNQIFMIGCAPARNESSSYISYGSSIITDPWGDVIGRLDDEEGILIQEIDFEMIDKIRVELPLLQHRRTDIYRLEHILG